MGPTLNNLDKLLRLPFGCGEQNMIHFAPNVFVLKYLQKTRQLSPEVENEATDYLLQGQQVKTFVCLFFFIPNLDLFAYISCDRKSFINPTVSKFTINDGQPEVCINYFPYFSPR